MSKTEKATREYLETLSKDQVIDLCLQFMFDAEISEQQLDQQKAMWNELKEHLNSQIVLYHKLCDRFKEENNDGCLFLSITKRQVLEEILYKMQELEKGEKDDNC